MAGAGTEDGALPDPGVPDDGELSLHLIEAYAGNPAIGWPPAYRFEIRVRPANVRVGYISLRIGQGTDLTLYAGHIGYDIDPRFRGHHYAARACRLLLPLARQNGLDPLWITCNPDNVASRRTCERLGATLVDVVDVPPQHEMARLLGDVQKCRYRLDLH